MGQEFGNPAGIRLVGLEARAPPHLLRVVYLHPADKSPRLTH
jgi:hypothetical protein